ncbi:MAG: Crp/Fnr family transcriptional regulator [Bacteroidota bacterium]
MKRLVVEKGKIIQRKGELNSKVYQVVSGLLRSYYIDSKGKEHIFMFAPEGWYIADTVLPTEPCELYIDAVENSEVIQGEKDPNSKQLDLPKLIRRIDTLQKRVVMMMSEPAINRYEHFLNTYPEIVQRVPQRMIASYLGITPEALSTIKRQHIPKK